MPSSESECTIAQPPFGKSVSAMFSWMPSNISILLPHQSAHSAPHTPFAASGIITSITTDANGTRHIALHNEPDAMAQWRYLGTALLMLVLIVSAVSNGLLVLRRIHRNRLRMAQIQQYYDKCFNHNLSTMQSVRSLF